MNKDDYKSYGIAKMGEYGEVYCMYNPNTDEIRWNYDFAMADRFYRRQADYILSKEPKAYVF